MIRTRLSSTCGAETCDPPAPVVNAITISDLTGNTHPELWDGLVDTGANRSVVPLSVCRDLGLSPRRYRRPRGFDPEAATRSVPVFYVRLGVKGLGDTAVMAYGLRYSNVLLGRDFLTDLVLLLDGGRRDFALGRHGFCSRIVTRLLVLR